MSRTVYSDDESDMEANAEDIRKEEARTARLAREADRREEELEKMRKQEKMRRKMGKKAAN